MEFFYTLDSLNGDWKIIKFVHLIHFINERFRIHTHTHRFDHLFIFTVMPRSI
jgi:hypothetical protein